jgi:hypothetical protein
LTAAELAATLLLALLTESEIAVPVSELNDADVPVSAPVRVPPDLGSALLAISYAVLTAAEDAATLLLVLVTESEIAVPDSELKDADVPVSAPVRVPPDLGSALLAISYTDLTALEDAATLLLVLLTESEIAVPVSELNDADVPVSAPVRVPPDLGSALLAVVFAVLAIS